MTNSNEKKKETDWWTLIPMIAFGAMAMSLAENRISPLLGFKDGGAIAGAIDGGLGFLIGAFFGSLIGRIAKRFFSN